MIYARRLAFKPIANLFAIILVIGLNVLHAQTPEILLLTIFMIYVAASCCLPRPSNVRKAGRRYL